MARRHINYSFTLANVDRMKLSLLSKNAGISQSATVRALVRYCDPALLDVALGRQKREEGPDYEHQQSS